MELRDLNPQSQIDTLIGSDLKYILNNFAEVLRPPTTDDVDALISKYRNGSSKQKHDLVLLLSIHVVQFSDSAWSWFESFTKDQDPSLQGIVFYTLTRADTVRFGRMLLTEQWSWSPIADYWVNHYGTEALIEATRALPFEQAMPRLAPWRLLEAARMRGADPTEVRLAAEAFGQLLADQKIDVPDPGSILLIDRPEERSSPLTYSVSPRPRKDDSINPMEALKAAMDVDAQVIAHRRAVQTASSRIREARLSGANLYLANIAPEDFVPVLKHATELVDQWLEGSDEVTNDFQRRVGLAEGVYLALCEALFIYAPSKGSQLWRSLREVLKNRYIGAADIEDLLHMVFRVSDSQAITALREELFMLEYCNTDEALFQLAIVMCYNHRTDILSNFIKADKASTFVWRRKRGIVLEGFTANNTLPVPGAWPEGEIRTTHAAIELKAARFQWIEACAHHWWRIYLNANNPTDAYAAWILFLRSADNRAWCWMHEDIQAANNDDTFFKLKLSNVQLNLSKLKQSMKKRINKLDENFIARKINESSGPWARDYDSVSTKS